MGEEKKDKLTLDSLQVALEKPLIFLRDRQPGMFTWHIALNNSLVELKKLLDTAFPGELLVATKSQYIIDLDVDPYIPDGWRIVEHKKGGQLVWDPAKIKLYLSVQQQNGRYIKGHQLRRELANKPTFNANVLDYLLAHSELIPEKWKNKRIHFWGTIYRDSYGGLCVRSLYFYGGRWYRSYSWLYDDWFGHEPAVFLAD